MTLSASTVWEVRSTATAGNVNGGGYTSGGTDYSQQPDAQLTKADLSTSGAGATTVTSNLSGFTDQMVGNIMHITAGTNFQAGWYEIITFTDANNVILDRTPSSGGAGATGTFYVGGALSLASTLDDDFFEAVIGGNTIHVKSGTYTLGEAVAVSSTSSTAQSPVIVIGYSSNRNDNPVGSTRPIIAGGANLISFARYWILKCLIFTGTGTSVVLSGTATSGILAHNCKALNSSTNASRNAFYTGSAGGGAFTFCEGISQNGVGIATEFSIVLFGCYAHDSVTGVNLNSSNTHVLFCLIESNSTTAINCVSTSGFSNFHHNTIYGSEAKIGTGILMTSTAANNHLTGNIFYGLTTGINQSTTQFFSNYGFYNCFNNNGTNATNYTLDSTDLTSSPQFVGASQLSGLTATTSGSVLTQSGGDFSSVTDNVDFLRVVSGTGVTAGIYLINSHTTTTLTVNNALGTSSAGNVIWSVPVGHNFAIGTNLKDAASPGLIPGSESTGYLDMGAVQRFAGSTVGSTFS